MQPHATGNKKFVCADDSTATAAGKHAAIHKSCSVMSEVWAAM
jgi:hypothetical protein